MLNTMTGRVLIVLSLIIFLALQYALWFGENGHLEQKQLRKQIAIQQEQNLELAERNRVLSAQVFDLKNGTSTVEEFARLDLGLIKPNETFVQMSMIDGSYQQIYLDEAQKNSPSSEDAMLNNDADENQAPSSTAH
ncbi:MULTISPECIES: septum formation initiator family protein [unclassified Acinetobacter]|uniref:septum formation initiator family protein n=1 Tax=unclassified Acinetobacter TaxID=196816 RepID=UPI0035B8EDBD